MQAGLWVFWLVFVSTAVGGTVVVYPGVKKRVRTWPQSLLAASMTASLVGATLGMLAGALVNAAFVMWRG